MEQAGGRIMKKFLKIIETIFVWIMAPFILLPLLIFPPKPTPQQKAQYELIQQLLMIGDKLYAKDKKNCTEARQIRHICSKLLKYV